MSRTRRPGRHPGKRLSPWRVGSAVLGVLVVVAAAVAVPLLSQREAGAEQAAAQPRWFGGYFDVTAAHVSEVPEVDPTSTVVLAFIVAESAEACVPTWGAAYSLSAASRDLDLDRRIARLRQGGADVAVSFGGALNTELGSACTSVDDLADAYEAVVDRYGITTIDLDIENTNLADKTASSRRAQAVAQLQQERRARGEELSVWLTLPVATWGLTDDGLSAVEQMLLEDVELSGVNAMTMDYGTDLGTQSMADASIDALTATHRQLTALFARQSVALPEGGAWAIMGATPMIGQNDIASEVFTLDDADELNDFASKNQLERMSMWSLNRDRTCGPNYPNLDIVSDSCSGVDQGDLSFAGILARGFDGESSTATPTATPRSTERPTPVATDDAATSPYPIWSPDAAYSAGVRVVWHGSVFAAKWWVDGEPEPDDPTLSASETAWTLIGPVLSTDEPFVLPTLPAGTYPDWTADTVYEKGDRVLFEGTPFEAQWWTQGDDPRIGITDHDRSPWELLSE